MDIVNDIKQFLADPHAPISREWLDEARTQYPYFTLPTLLFLEREKQDNRERDEELISSLAIATPDRRALADALGDNAFKYSSFYPQEEAPATPDTNSTLDSFLNQFGSQDEKEIEVLNQLIFNPTPDYAQMLAAEEQKNKPSADEVESQPTPTTENDALINKFIAQSQENKGHFPTQVVDIPKPIPTPPPFEHVEAPVENNESMLTESLAKIYIKQRKYSKALEIIKSLSLKFPEKSIYFADQIRFLQKLIITQNIKNNK